MGHLEGTGLLFGFVVGEPSCDFLKSRGALSNLRLESGFREAARAVSLTNAERMGMLKSICRDVGGTIGASLD